jgi:two-component system OmpR family response regulator
MIFRTALLNKKGAEMRKARILLVDDEVALTRQMSQLLSKRGYEVASVQDGTSAVKAVEESEFDVVLLDLKMPSIDGIETLRVIKKKKPLVEVIILTGHGSVDSAIDGVGYGAFDYATKPFILDDLIERIRQAFERKLIHEDQEGRGNVRT